ncbi:hypothetical protein G6F24_017989 [Rhizopus arrhizus]|nr:hypothetical protein G6F24_017989 [Rhizopus arrhizus]
MAYRWHRRGLAGENLPGSTASWNAHLDVVPHPGGILLRGKSHGVPFRYRAFRACVRVRPAAVLPGPAMARAGLRRQYVHPLRPLLGARAERGQRADQRHGLRQEHQLRR